MKRTIVILLILSTMLTGCSNAAQTNAPAVTEATEAVSHETAKEEKASQTTTGAAVTVQPSEVTTAAIDTAAVTTAPQSKPTASETTSAETTTVDKPKATTSAKKTDMTKSSVSTTRPEQQKPDASAQPTATETTRKKLMTEIYTSEEMDKIADEFLREELKYVNIERAKEGLQPLQSDDRLQAAAMLRAKEASEYYSHTRPDGRECLSVLDDLYDYDECADIDIWAENLSASASLSEDISAAAAHVVEGWMQSEGHRANILLPDITHVGLGCCYASSVTDFGGGEIYVDEYFVCTQLFATIS